MLLAMARLRYNALQEQMRLSPTSADYLDLLKMVDAIDEGAGLWTGRPDYFSANPRSAGEGGKM